MAGDINNPIMPSDWEPTNSIIKVIGVGGGGCNAVSYMYNQGIKGCSFIVCNTDSQALKRSPVPTKIQLGEGLGAGTNPTAGRNAAIEAEKVIAEKVLDNGTQMLFITAGMGGGTGTGAAPVIAKLAKARGILTVGVVTLPFKNEGNESQAKAVDGIHEMELNVDSLLIINNDKIGEYYGDELIHKAFPKTDEVLATAVKGVIEIITKEGYINVDFKDVTNMMRGSGMALMGSGIGKGENRLREAVKGALESPLLNDFDLKTARNILINITVSGGDDSIKFSELDEINDMIAEYTGGANRFKQGIIYDPEVHDEVHITAIATGFDMGQLGNITDINKGNIIVIKPNFTFKPESRRRDDVPEPAEGRVPVIVIGSDMDGRRGTFDYDPSDKPVLAVDPGEDRSALESIPAIRRKKAAIN